MQAPNPAELLVWILNIATCSWSRRLADDVIVSLLTFDVPVFHNVARSLSRRLADDLNVLLLSFDVSVFWSMFMVSAVC